MNQAELNEALNQHMEWTQSKGASGKQLNLQGVSLKSLEFKDTVIMNAKFSDVCFAAARFNKVILRNCKFDACDFSFSEFVDSFVSNNKIDFCVFALTLVHHSAFLENDMEADLFERVIFSGSSRFKDNQLKLVNFDSTEFIKYDSKYAEDTQLEEIYRKSIAQSAKLIEDIEGLLEEGESNMSAQSQAQDLMDEFKEISRKIEKSKMPPAIRERAIKELKKLTQIPPMSSEFSMQRGYVDSIISIPWGENSEIKRDIAYAAKVLDQDHYGLEKVKERVLEYLAVNAYKKEGGSGATVLCLQGPPGIGKCLGKGTPIIMYDGTIKKVEDVNVGDVLMGDDSKPRNVLSLARGREMMYRVTPVKGDSYVVNESHILSLKLDGKVKDIDVKTYLLSKQRERHKGYRVGVDFNENKDTQLPLDPYFLGAWLGDGHSHIPAITTMDMEIRDHTQFVADSHGLSIGGGYICGKAKTYTITSRSKKKSSNGVLNILRDLQVIDNKHIPHQYLVSSRQNRLELLAGLIDTDGHLVSNGTGYDWISVNERLADDMLFLCRSLGFAAYKKACEKRAKFKDGTYSQAGTYFRLSISGQLSEVPVKLSRKKANPRKQIKDVLVTGITVTPIGEGDYYGFEIDGNKRFLLGDFTVTHNTSLTASIAKATGRELVSIALGGVSDEAEIRGHRRTYIGAMSGKIVNAIRKSGKMNPLVLLDEVDKLGSQHKGDPSAALLEVLDPAQNSKFNDHYLDMDLDLSGVMFVCTSNNLSSIPAPLRDRMEIIHLTGYTESEKIKIATNHMANKVLKQNGLESAKLSLSQEAALEMIRYHTREAGVRTLEKVFASVCRKIVKSALDGNKELVTGHGRNLGFKNAVTGTRKVITKEIVSKLLGDRKYEDELASEQNEVGYAQGLAYTSVGGAFLPIEVLPLKSKNGGTFKITGQLGDVMKESTQVAFTVVKKLVESLDSKYEEFINTREFHIHFPDTSTPKDGPSAGLIITTAIFSAVTGVPFDKLACGTGEIDLRGNALPIGGVREKMFAAYTAGAKKAFLPKANEKEVKEVSEEVRKALDIRIVKKIEEVLLLCLSFDDVSQGASIKAILEEKLGLAPISKVNTLSV